MRHEKWRSFAQQLALKLAQTDRFIAPYIARERHGAQVYEAIAHYFLGTGAKRFWDLGCGSGPLLEEIKAIPEAELSSVTSHQGKVDLPLTSAVCSWCSKSLGKCAQVYLEYSHGKCDQQLVCPCH